MKDRIIEIFAIIIVIIAIIITWLALNINNLNYIELGKYSLVTNNSNLVIAKENNLDEIEVNNHIVYIYYEKEKLVTKEGIIRDINIGDNDIKKYKIKSNKDIVSIDSSCIIGKYIISIPILGSIINFAITRDGFLTLIVLPLLVICIYELFKFVDTISNVKTKK